MYSQSQYGDYKKSLDYYEKASEIQQKIAPNSNEYVRTLLEMADIYNYIYGDIALAEPLYNNAIGIKKYY